MRTTTNGETRDFRLVPDRTPKKLSPMYQKQVKSDWKRAERAIENLAKHLPKEATSNLLDALFMCPDWMSD